MNLIRNFRRKLKRLFRYLPVIWGSEDWDYCFTLELFRMKLEDMVEYYEGRVNVFSTNGEYIARRIRRVLRLFDWVYSDGHMSQCDAEFESKYGNEAKKLVQSDFWDGGDRGRGWSMKYEYESWDNADEVREFHRQLVIKYGNKHKKAHKLLWSLIERNIQHWWD